MKKTNSNTTIYKSKTNNITMKNINTNTNTMIKKNKTNTTVKSPTSKKRI